MIFRAISAGNKAVSYTHLDVYKRQLSIGRIAQQVRTSGPPPSGMNDATDSTPGPMPFFEPSELPASDLADIVAFLTGG